MLDRHSDASGTSTGGATHAVPHLEERPAILNVPGIPQAGIPQANGKAAGGVLAVERGLIRRLLHSLGDPPICIVLWNGEAITTSTRSPVARLVFRDRAPLYRLVLNPDFQFGEMYSQGRIDVQGDLVELFEAVFQSQLDRLNGGHFHTARPNRSRRGALGRARENIHHHYDIGNSFYKLWLDEQMLYTCAYFETAHTSLEAAQVAKMEHVCRKLRLVPGERVVEAGCGWGALALHMARHHGVTVRAYNISHEQVMFARARAKVEGLESRVEFVEDDYRTIDGHYDAFVSVGMLEHVGPANYHELGGVIDRCLPRDRSAGRGLIHTIGRNLAMRMDPWIAARIFPGACPPSLKEMMNIFEPYSLSVLDIENLRLHYALTLRHWLARFEAHHTEFGAMFDQRFVRMWRLYLASSQVAFTTGWMQLFQVVFNRATNNDIPLTRRHLYFDAGG